MGWSSGGGGGDRGGAEDGHGAGPFGVRQKQHLVPDSEALLPRAHHKGFIDHVELAGLDDEPREVLVGAGGPWPVCMNTPSRGRPTTATALRRSSESATDQRRAEATNLGRPTN